MKKLKGNFTTIPNEYITDKNLDCFEYRILCYLCKLSDEENSAYPSYETIARKTNISLSKTKKSIERLITLKYISKKQRKKTNGSPASNLYMVFEKNGSDDISDLEKPTDSVSQDQDDSVSEIPGSVCDDRNKYINKNTNIFNNNQSSSIDGILEKAEIENLSGRLHFEFKTAIEKMYNQKYITVSGEKIMQENVRRRLENISYEHICFVDNNMPRIVFENHTIKKNVASPVPYIISALYNALEFTKDEIIAMEFS